MAWRKIALLASAARTATVASAKQYTPNIKRAIIFIDVTSVTATPIVTFNVRAHKPDPAATADDAVSVLDSAVIGATGNTLLYIGPGIEAAANVAISRPLPAEWDVNASHGDADSITYSVSAWIEE